MDYQKFISINKTVYDGYICKIVPKVNKALGNSDLAIKKYADILSLASII